jgi:hypothetical protein
MENKTLSAEPLLLLIWKKRKLFIIAGILAAVVSAGASFMIPIKFKSTCSIFPTKSNSLPLGERILPPHGTELFGEEAEGERMLAILNSSQLTNAIITRHNLFKHYDIDPKSSTKNDLMAAAIKEHIQYERTRHGSVDIIVWDANPDTAANVANDIAYLFDQVQNKVIMENAQQNYLAMKKQYDLMLEDMHQLQDTMTSLRKMGVVGEQEALAALLERQTLAMQKGGQFAEEVNQQVKNNELYGGVYIAFYSRMNVLAKRLETLEGNVEQLRSDAMGGISHKYTIDRAYAPDKKAYPIRWLVVVVSTISTLFLLLALLVVLQKISQLKRAA